MKRMIVLLSVMLAFSSWVVAAEKRGIGGEPTVSMEQAISTAKKEAQGKVILSVLAGELYTIRIKAADGTISTVKIDATTGSVVKDAVAPRYGDGFRNDIQDRGIDRRERGGFSRPGNGRGFKKGFGDNEDGEHEGRGGREREDDDD